MNGMIVVREEGSIRIKKRIRKNIYIVYMNGMIMVREEGSNSI